MPVDNLHELDCEGDFPGAVQGGDVRGGIDPRRRQEAKDSGRRWHVAWPKHLLGCDGPAFTHPGGQAMCSVQRLAVPGRRGNGG
ncbi:MAG: hypothetical protein ACR2G2_00955 [Pseudonocardia sp.]